MLPVFTVGLVTPFRKPVPLPSEHHLLLAPQVAMVHTARKQNQKHQQREKLQRFLEHELEHAVSSESMTRYSAYPETIQSNHSIRSILSAIAVRQPPQLDSPDTLSDTLSPSISYESDVSMTSSLSDEPDAPPVIDKKTQGKSKDHHGVFSHSDLFPIPEEAGFDKHLGDTHLHEHLLDKQYLGAELQPVISVVSVISVDSTATSDEAHSPYTITRPLLELAPELPERKPRAPTKSALKSLKTLTTTGASPTNKRFFKRRGNGYAAVPRTKVSFAPRATYLTITDSHAPSWVRSCARTTQPLRDGVYTLGMKHLKRELYAPTRRAVAGAVALLSTSPPTRQSTYVPPEEEEEEPERDVSGIGEPLHRVMCKERTRHSLTYDYPDERSAHTNSAVHTESDITESNMSNGGRIPIREKARLWFSKYRRR